MPESPTQQFLQQLDGASVQHMATELGLTQTQTTGAIGTAMPLLLQALGWQNDQTQEPPAAQELLGMLQRHPGSSGKANTLLAKLLGSGATSKQDEGPRIVQQILGTHQPAIELALGKATGLGAVKAAGLLQMLAPMAMAFFAARALGGRDGNTEPRHPAHQPSTQLPPAWAELAERVAPSTPRTPDAPEASTPVDKDAPERGR